MYSQIKHNMYALNNWKHEKFTVCTSLKDKDGLLRNDIALRATTYSLALANIVSGLLNTILKIVESAYDILHTCKKGADQLAGLRHQMPIWNMNGANAFHLAMKITAWMSWLIQVKTCWTYLLVGFVMSQLVHLKYNQWCDEP